MACKSIIAVLCLLVASAACASAAAATSPTKLPILMCDDTGYDGGCQNFAMTLPAVGTCSSCNNLNLLRTNSWESYVVGTYGNAPTSIILYDGHGCTGKDSGKIATWGVIPGTLKDSVDAIKICNEPALKLPVTPYAPPAGRKMV